MKSSIKLEEVSMFVLSILLFNQMEFAWWWYPVLLLAPDISMLGYLFGTKAGAFSYNLFHHKGIAVIVLAVGWQLTIPEMTLAGIILFGHSSMDRAFGYGLKYPDSFQHTHLGWLKGDPNQGE